MRIHREGFATLIISVVVLVGLSLTINAIIGTLWLKYVLYILLWTLFGIVVYFFRNPLRVTEASDREVIAPCDGKVVVIEEVVENEFLQKPCRQISIFMSPLNVHVNRNPINGIVEYTQYHPGKYLVAWHPKSSEENERTTIVINNGKHRVLFRQIAGALARRIVYYLRDGQQVNAGEEMGFIKFGSRMDVFVPLEAEIKVDIAQKTKGGQTILAILPE